MTKRWYARVDALMPVVSVPGTVVVDDVCGGVQIHKVVRKNILPQDAGMRIEGVFLDARGGHLAGATRTHHLQVLLDLLSYDQSLDGIDTGACLPDLDRSASDTLSVGGMSGGESPQKDQCQRERPTKCLACGGLNHT